MGIGSSREGQEYMPRRQSPAPKPGKLGKKKRKRRFFRKIRPAPTTQLVIPVKHRSHHRHPYGLRPFIPPIPPYAALPLSPPVYPRYMPMSYNNYAAPYYTPPYQPMMMSPQQIQPMVLPQQVPQFQPMMSQPAMMRQPAMMPPSMMMPQQVPQQVPQFQPMAMPQRVFPPMYSPYMSPPYSTGVQYSTPYPQQQPQMQPVYNNIGVSPLIHTGMTGQNRPYSTPYPVTTIKITDWTGGGKISPGFLGPPI